MVSGRIYTQEEINMGQKLFAGGFEFLKGCVQLTDLPPANLPEIAFAGRSNVGKSSLINALVGQKSLARTSNSPGRTQELNIFVHKRESLRIVDMPGYGYAKAPKAKIAAWNKLIHLYLAGRPNLRRLYLLIDARHGVKANDLSLMNELDNIALSYQLVLTKIDKIPKNNLVKIISSTSKIIAKRPAAHPFIMISSARNGEGIKNLRAEIALL